MKNGLIIFIFSSMLFFCSVNPMGLITESMPTPGIIKISDVDLIKTVFYIDDLRKVLLEKDPYVIEKNIKLLNEKIKTFGVVKSMEVLPFFGLTLMQIGALLSKTLESKSGIIKKASLELLNTSTGVVLSNVGSFLENKDLQKQALNFANQMIQAVSKIAEKDPQLVSTTIQQLQNVVLKFI